MTTASDLRDRVATVISAAEWGAVGCTVAEVRAKQADAAIRVVLEEAAKVLHETYYTASKNHSLREDLGVDAWADHSNGYLEGISDSITWVESLIPKENP